jgi:hypothetical protein
MTQPERLPIHFHAYAAEGQMPFLPRPLYGVHFMPHLFIRILPPAAAFFPRACLKNHSRHLP